MKTQVKFKDIAGKTIVGVDVSDYHLLMSFTDGTFAYLSIDGDEDGTDVRDSEMSLPFLPTIPVLQLGIATEEELKDAIEANRIATEQWVDERDRREFERLKARFEKKE